MTLARLCLAAVDGLVLINEQQHKGQKNLPNRVTASGGASSLGREKGPGPHPPFGARDAYIEAMKPGDRVRFRRASKAIENWKVPRAAIGTVLACYDLRKQARVDVGFPPYGNVWGERAREFELIG